MGLVCLNNCLVAPMPVKPKAPEPNMPEDISYRYNEVYKKINKRRSDINPLGTDGLLRYGLTRRERRKLNEIDKLYHSTPEYRDYQRRLTEYHNSDEYKQYRKELRRWMVLC